MLLIKCLLVALYYLKLYTLIVILIMQKTVVCDAEPVSLRTMCNAIFYKDMVEPHSASFNLVHRYLNKSVEVLRTQVSPSLEIKLCNNSLLHLWRLQ